MGFLAGARRVLPALGLLLLGAAGVAHAGCYDTGDGSDPPLESFYFPVGAQVSHGGSVLYVINSDFDLQYNGGTLQSYDLLSIKRDALRIIADPNSLPEQRVRKGNIPGCPRGVPAEPTPVDGRLDLGEGCAPPIYSEGYVQDVKVIGAFATELLLTPPQARLAATDPTRPVGSSTHDRLFAPLRGSASILWASVLHDDPNIDPPRLRGKEPTTNGPSPYRFECGNATFGGRCDAAHAIGEDEAEPGNTRGLKMPGEPFGMALSEDGTSLVLTHQNETRTSLYTTGVSREQRTSGNAQGDGMPAPAMQFILDEVPIGGVGITAIPHDRDAFDTPAQFPRPAFFQTTRAGTRVSLLRYYPDDGTTNVRPFLNFESALEISSTAGGTDSRDIVIDPTPRLRCKAGAGGNAQALQDCARRAARAFITQRSPPTLLRGTVGEEVDGTDVYDPDRLTLLEKPETLAAGPSRIYLAPIVESDGSYQLRVFVISFDAATIQVFDPDAPPDTPPVTIRVAPGPSSLAFEPFDMDEVARSAQVPMDPRLTEPDGKPVRRYRFAYLTSFTQSHIQIIDLDNSREDKSTFGRVIFTLGKPTNPKGT